MVRELVTILSERSISNSVNNIKYMNRLIEMSAFSVEINHIAIITHLLVCGIVYGSPKQV